MAVDRPALERRRQSVGGATSVTSAPSAAKREHVRPGDPEWLDVADDRDAQPVEIGRAPRRAVASASRIV